MRFRDSVKKDSDRFRANGGIHRKSEEPNGYVPRISKLTGAAVGATPRTKDEEARANIRKQQSHARGKRAKPVSLAPIKGLDNDEN